MKRLSLLFCVALLTLTLLCFISCDVKEVESDTSETVMSTETESATEATASESTETEHTHTWNDATCDNPKTCSTCSATEGEAKGHTWTDATCDKPKTCSVCDKTDGEALGHTWTDATCDNPKTCSVCSKTEGEALGHTWTDATCETPKTCSTCSVTDGEALGHTWTDATCETPKTCTICSATQGEAAGHAWTDATCTIPKTCTSCGATEGKELGHTGGEATCLGRAKCERCGKVYGDVGKHIYEAEVVDAKYLSTAATMVRPATYFYSCIHCGAKGTKRFAYGGSIVEQITGPYNQLFGDNNDGEGYLYFTDPHPVNCEFNAAFWVGKEARFEKLAELYGYSKASFAVCGGDWFNNSNSKDSALEMLAYIKEMTTKLFGTCYLVVGNHDYNYQFVTNGTNGRSEHMLTPEEIASKWYPDNNGKTYYSFTGENSRYYVFDSGIDWGRGNCNLTDYDKEQAAWYLEQLKANDDKHIVLMPHMVFVSGLTDNYNGGTLEFARISNAYNNRETYTFNGVTYDFSEKTGTVEYIIAGHNHSDYSGTLEGIPVILTSTNNSGDPATADFVYADYDARKLHLVRSGNGETRVIDLLPTAE